jgi:hypothetical protein
MDTSLGPDGGFHRSIPRDGSFAVPELARRGAHILAVGHNSERGTAAVEAIRGIGGSAELLCGDTGDAADVHAAAVAVRQPGLGTALPPTCWTLEWLKGEFSEHGEGPTLLGFTMSQHLVLFYAAVDA